MAVKKQAVEAVAEVKPEDVSLAAALQAELTKALAEIQALKEELSLTNEQLDESRAELDEARAALAAADGETAPTESVAEFMAGKTPPPDDAEVVAIKSRHGHAFWRAGYQVQPDWTFIRRADFEPADFARLIADRMVDAREALPPQGEAE
jgi:multidrug efflux pump subunit AcrA (membrane-fusion protein)